MFIRFLFIQPIIAINKILKLVFSAFFQVNSNSELPVFCFFIGKLSISQLLNSPARFTWLPEFGLLINTLNVTLQTGFFLSNYFCKLIINCFKFDAS